MVEPRGRRTGALRPVLLLIAALALLGAGTVPAAVAGAFESPVFHETVAPTPLGGPRGGRYPFNVAGTYVPVPMTCGIEQRVLWYAPGSAADSLWRNVTFPSSGPVGHTDVTVSISGTYQPLTGDFDGDGCGDVLWYAPGTAADSIWYFAPDGTFDARQLDIDGTYTPLVGNFDPSSATDEVFWYAPGATPESIWVAAVVSGSVVRGTFLAGAAPQVSGTFAPMVNYTNRGILWYAAGAGQDYLWNMVTAGETTADSAPTTIGGSYEARTVSGMPLLWTPGPGADRLVTGTQQLADGVALVTVPGEIDPVSVVAASSRRTGFTVLHEPGPGTDWLLVPRLRTNAGAVTVGSGSYAGAGATCTVVGSRGLVQCRGEGYGPGGAATAAARTISGVSAATQVTVGKGFGCARRRDGRVLCWGANGYGQLGRGTVSAVEPVAAQVPGAADALEVRAGDDYACARLAASVRCWGRNEFGQLGNGSFASSSPTPVAVVDPSSPPVLGGVTELSAGPLHACVVAGGRAFCWGRGSSGQLGNGSTTAVQRTPVRATSCSSALCPVTTYSRITAGERHTCALANAAAVCWGSDAGGQLGNGPGAVSATRPVPVVGLPEPTTDTVASMSAGSDRTCAVLGSSALWCWGSNATGGLGTGGPTVTGVAPVAVSPVGGWRAVSVGRGHACATDVFGQVACWGQGDVGQLGQYAPSGFADLADRAVPTFLLDHLFILFEPVP